MRHRSFVLAQSFQIFFYKLKVKINEDKVSYCQFFFISCIHTIHPRQILLPPPPTLPSLPEPTHYPPSHPPPPPLSFTWTQNWILKSLARSNFHLLRTSLSLFHALLLIICPLFHTLFTLILSSTVHFCLSFLSLPPFWPFRSLNFISFCMASNIWVDAALIYEEMFRLLWENGRKLDKNERKSSIILFLKCVHNLPTFPSCTLLMMSFLIELFSKP